MPICSSPKILGGPCAWLDFSWKLEAIRNGPPGDFQTGTLAMRENTLCVALRKVYVPAAIIACNRLNKCSCIGYVCASTFGPQLLRLARHCVNIRGTVKSFNWVRGIGLGGKMLWYGELEMERSLDLILFRDFNFNRVLMDTRIIEMAWQKRGLKVYTLSQQQ